MQHTAYSRFFIILAGIFMLGSCSSLNSTVGEFFKFDTDLTIAFKVDADINPDDRKTPSPLFIRMYEFKATKMFEKANFLDIFEKDKEALGADLVAKQRLKRLKPGEDAEFSFVLDKSTQYVGIYAEFLEYKNATYKVIIPVVKSNVITTSATIHVSGNTIRVSP